MPPPAPTGRLVIADSRAMVPERNSHILYLSDIDAEVAENVRRMTRSAGTYQDYLLYTNEYLPDRMFFPGFALTQKPNRRVEVLREQARHDVESDAAAAPAPQRPAAAPPAKP